MRKYELGAVIGQGSYGIIYAGKRRETEKEYAVKLTSLMDRDAPREAHIHSKLEHPRIVKLYDVYFEKSFVCLVLELHHGGNMIDGLNRHWQRKDMLALSVVQNISKMVAQSVAYLHQHAVVHRDLKGDNFLMDLREIEDPSCRIFLSDFGTAVELRPEQRLSERCGTVLYWSPEFFDLNYSFAVDMWAMGVLNFLIATGSFPFCGEADCKNKPVKCPSRFSRIAKSYILAALARDEARRMTAGQALKHKFLASAKSDADLAQELCKFDARGMKLES